jgi:hypothetical protein
MIFQILKTTDIILFSVLAGLIIAAVALYFLIPLLNQKKYKRSREDLARREEAYYKNKGIVLDNNETK